MNDVATPPKSAQVGELRVAPARAPAVQPEWQFLLACLLNDIREVLATVAEIGDKIGPDEPAICTLLDCALDEIYKVKHNLEARPLYVATTDAAYEALFEPLAYLQGAAAMAKLLPVDIFSGAIEQATGLLDEVQNHLSSQAIGRILPKVLAEPVERDAPQEPTGRTWLEAIHEAMEKRCVATHVLSQWVDHADCPAAYGLLTLLVGLGATMDKEKEKGKADWDDLITGMFPRVSDEILIVSEVARALDSYWPDDQTLKAVIHLLDYSKQTVDGFIESERAARTIPAGRIVNV